MTDGLLQSTLQALSLYTVYTLDMTDKPVNSLLFLPITCDITTITHNVGGSIPT